MWFFWGADWTFSCRGSNHYQLLIWKLYCHCNLQGEETIPTMLARVCLAAYNSCLPICRSKKKLDIFTLSLVTSDYLLLRGLGVGGSGQHHLGHADNPCGQSGPARTNQFDVSKLLLLK